MIYTNKDLYAQDREMDWGTLHQITMGEHGRGRQLITLPCPPDVDRITSGLHGDLSIGQTKSGRPRIVRAHDDKLYMLLSAHGAYTRRGNGVIYTLDRDFDKFTVLCRGNGADGDAGRIGFWDCLVLEAPLTDAIVRVRTSGAGYGTPSDLYIIHEASVYHCTIESLQECCDAIGIDVPCITKYNDNSTMVFGDDWRRI